MTSLTFLQDKSIRGVIIYTVHGGIVLCLIVISTGQDSQGLFMGDIFLYNCCFYSIRQSGAIHERIVLYLAAILIGQVNRGIIIYKEFWGLCYI